MEYTISFNGNEYKLPSYNLKVAEKIEKISATYYSQGKISDKSKDIYNFVADLIGKEETNTAIGKLNDLDLNELDIIYSEIIEAYSKPLAEYRNDKAVEKIDNSAISDLLKLVEAIPQLKELSKTK